ncbi:hypothetical protein XENOCAPTIV_004320 [Xenoophorus captivus]|uniref:Uncharacterized protein n=1 Tax=Xenoophorus captivus TaxID=1517983 RepID=A0ABV0RFG9_9TELE
MHAQGKHANPMQKDPWPGIEPRTFLLQGNSATKCTTMQPIQFSSKSRCRCSWLWAGRISCSVRLTADLKKPLTEETVVVEQSHEQDAQGSPECSPFYKEFFIAQ